MPGAVIVDQLTTMLSATSSPSRVQQAPTTTQPFEDGGRYRRTTYRNDRGVHVVESPKHRRPRPAPTHGGAVQSSPCYRPEGDFQLFPDPSSSTQPADPSSQRSQLETSHVTVKSSKSRKRQVKVIANGKMSTLAQNSNPLSLEARDVMLKPPSAPRPQRLPSPDLPDLPEHGFCECGITSDARKRCQYCPCAGTKAK